MKPEIAFAQWLADNYPEVFGAALTHAQSPTKMGLAGWSDTLSSIGSTLASAIGGAVKYGSAAVSAVANYVSSPTGQQTIGKLADLYVATKANKDAIGVQLSNVAAANPPAPIVTQTNTATGATVPFYAPPGQPPQVLTPQISQQLLTAAQSGGMGGAMVPLAIGGGVLMLVLLMKRRRR